MKAAVAALLTAAGVVAAHPAVAQQPTRRETAWRGTIRCGIIPGLTRIPLNQPFTLIVSEGRARYSRAVRQPDKIAETGYVEQGAGRIAPDGSLTLTGAATGRGFRYTARYAGRLPPGGGSASLVGAQQWTVHAARTYARPCRIDLAR